MNCIRVIEFLEYKWYDKDDNTNGFLRRGDMMARPKRQHEKIKVCTELEKYYHDFVKRYADKNGISVSEMVRRCVVYQVDKKNGGTEITALEPEQLARLNEIAKEKGMSINDLMTRVLSNYIDTYF